MAIFKAITFVALFALLQGVHASFGPAFSTDPRTQRIVDRDGRERYFHGANVVVKGPPYVPDRSGFNSQSFVAADMQVMQDLGLNAIRLGTMWPGAEPQQGHYNMTYLATLRSIVSEARTFGIHALMDMHQDIMSRKFCGEGVPVWATRPNVTNFPWPIESKPFNVSAEGVPTHAECMSHDWSIYYPTQATGQAFQNLYDNAFGLRGAWAKFWQTTAGVMRSLGDAVLGYELINEPWAGDVWRDPLLMIPGVADKQNLQGFYEVGQAAIRAVDTEHQIYFESVTWDDFGVGFTQVPGGDAWRNKSVLSYHFYVPPDFSIPIQFGARVKDMKRLGSAGMLTEFAAKKCKGCGDVEPGKVMDACDEHKQSWLFWQLKKYSGLTGDIGVIFNADGSVNQETANVVSRTYPQIVAGAAETISYDITTAAFLLKYTVLPHVTNRTSEIYVPVARHYPAGMHVSVNATGASGVQWWQASKNIVAVAHGPSAPAGTVVTVSIKRK